ncbi:acyltransferase domain-containing protein, partial [Mycolicibacterium vaccae]|nr:acyltransferase domain-containing protein [Mycolicibacterium vaccae]
AVIAAVTAQERFARRVNMEVASHTALMDPVLPELHSALEDLAPKAPRIAFFSTVADGDMGAAAPLLDAEYWVANVRRPVRLRQAVSAAADQHATFIEISPHPMLTHAVTETLESTHHHSIATLLRDGDDTVSFHTNLNRTYVAAPPQTPHPPEPHPVLPSTPWQHTQHWISAENRVRATESAPRPGTLLGEHITIHYHADHPLVAGAACSRDQTVSGFPPEPRGRACSGICSAADTFDGGSRMWRINSVGRAIRVPDHRRRARVIQVVADGATVTVSSSAAAQDGEQHWVRHVSAQLGGPLHGSQPRPRGDDENAGHPAHRLRR